MKDALPPMPPQYPDVNANAGVQIHIDSTGRRAWVNVDGICVLRVISTKDVEVLDDRPKHQQKPWKPPA